MSENANAATEPEAKRSLEEEIELARRAFALKQYEQAVDHYATALELQTEQFGDHASENADLYFAYGKALLENAIANSGVLGKSGEGGKEDGEDDDEPVTGGSLAGAFFSFSGDGDAEEDESEVPPDSDAPVDLFAEAEKAVKDADEEAAEGQEEEEEGDDEPEDDFNAAWEILDLARSLFDKRKDEDDEIKLKLADTYVALGDVSLETEKFEQAIKDYEAGLALKTSLLPISSRQLAEVHYKLSLVLDMTAGRLKDAIKHVEKTLESTQARLEELQAALADNNTSSVESTAPTADEKGKGKAAGLRLTKDSVNSLTKPQIEAEIKDMTEMSNDLKLKLEELAQPTEEPEKATGVFSAPELVAQALDRELNGAGSSSAVSGQLGKVNDLTGMVKKKKKADTVISTSGGTVGEKRKADDEASTPTEKRAKVESEPSSAS